MSEAAKDGAKEKKVRTFASVCTSISQTYIISYHSDIISEHLEIIQLIYLYPAELKVRQANFGFIASSLARFNL